MTDPSTHHPNRPVTDGRVTDGPGGVIDRISVYLGLISGCALLAGLAALVLGGVGGLATTLVGVLLLAGGAGGMVAAVVLGGGPPRTYTPAQVLVEFTVAVLAAGCAVVIVIVMAAWLSDTTPVNHTRRAGVAAQVTAGSCDSVLPRRDDQYAFSMCKSSSWIVDGRTVHGTLYGAPNKVIDKGDVVAAYVLGKRADDARNSASALNSLPRWPGWLIAALAGVLVALMFGNGRFKRARRKVA